MVTWRFPGDQHQVMATRQLATWKGAQRQANAAPSLPVVRSPLEHCSKPACLLLYYPSVGGVHTP